MFGLPGLQELVILIVIIAVLMKFGLWSGIVRGLRELRGDPIEEPPQAKEDVDLCYKLLGLPPSASWEEIEKAYRRKAKVHHPDLKGDDDAMRALNDAYQHLKRLRGR